MRVCIVYDCLYPYTIGGAERWYRSLAERVASAGHDVTFLTRRQWDQESQPTIEGVRVVAVAPRTGLYTRRGRRRILPPLLFGIGVLDHLRRPEARYHVVHTSSFPYFSLLAAAIARRSRRFQLCVDWHEVWTHAYWCEYLGAIGGRVGWHVQQAALRVPQHAFCFSSLHQRRLEELGVRGEVVRLEGQLEGATEPATPAPGEPVVVFAGRHTPEKRVSSLVPALARARQEIGDLRADIFGDGPERGAVERAIAAHGLDEVVRVRGFVDAEVLDEALAKALCFALPSRREGYGRVVVEAAARGVPVVVVADPDNAAAELVEEGVNGAVAPSARPEDLGEAIIRVYRGGVALRRSTAAWFTRNAERLSVERSVRAVLEVYAALAHEEGKCQSFEGRPW